MTPAAMEPIMTRRARKERVRHDILEAAAGLLARNGYHGMSMRDLAADSGTNLANLYNYFASKQELLFALQTRSFETLIAAAERAVAEAGDDPGRLHAFILNHVRFVSEHPDVMRVLVEEAGELPAAHRRAVRRLKERYYALGEARVRAVMSDAGATRTARDGGAVERATYAVFGMLNWIYAWYQPRRHGSPEEVACALSRMAFGGLAAPAPHRATPGPRGRRIARIRVPSPIAPGRRGLVNGSRP